MSQRMSTSAPSTARLSVAQIMNNLGQRSTMLLLSPFLILLRQGVWFSHALARLVVQGEVEVGKVEGPSGLPAVKLLGHPEVFKVLVICPDLKLVLHAFEKVLTLLEQPDDGQHLLVMDLVVLLHCIQAFGVEGHWMPLPILWRLLQEHHPSGKVRAVGLYIEGRVVVWEKENGSRGHSTFEGVKGQLLWRSPAPCNILFCEVKQWADMMQEVLGESLGSGHSTSLALLQFDVELVLAEVFQDEMNEDVVKVHAHYTLHNEVLEDVVHHGLKGGGAIGETKEHNKWFEQPLVGLEGCLPFVSLLNAHIVVTPLDIQFCEVSRALEVVGEFEDEGKRVAILHYHGVEYLVVLYQLERAILFFDEEDWRSHWGLGWMDTTGVQVLLEEGIELILLSGHKGVDLTAGGCQVRQQFDSVVPPLALQKQVKGGQ
ncbi:hypothetical protein E4T56_gene13754 [Termitomyces sp. T112]|nr:hypothetical protein E4T56_gene13754 [Termitomyces sp. T112]